MNEWWDMVRYFWILEWWMMNNDESTRVWCHRRYECCWCGASGDGMIWGPYRPCAPRFLFVGKDPFPWSKEVEELFCVAFSQALIFDSRFHFSIFFLLKQAIFQLLGMVVAWRLAEGNAVICRAGEIRRSKSLAGWGGRQRFMLRFYWLDSCHFSTDQVL